METIEMLISGIFSEQLLKSEKRLQPASAPIKIRLDKNESAYEVSSALKERVLDRVRSAEWRKYPPPYYNELEAKLAQYCGVQKEQVVPAAGSANIIAALLNYFGVNKRQIVLAHPSFSLYEYHCKTYGIPYELWKLNENLEYDVGNLPALKPYSMVMFASPNNPVGNVIPTEMLEQLLKDNSKSIFVVDEVYSEFCDANLTPLLKRHSNLILLRSFSKSFSSAGIRVGYLIANERFANNIRKLIIPFALNYMAVELALGLLSEPEFIAENKKNILLTINERVRMEKGLRNIGSRKGKFSITHSNGNFLMLKFANNTQFEIINRILSEEGIVVLNLFNVPMLKNSMRITIGKPEENDAVLAIFRNYF